MAIHPSTVDSATLMADRYAASPVHQAQRLAILADESGRLCKEILAGMAERERQMHAIWNPSLAAEGGA